MVIKGGGKRRVFDEVSRREAVRILASSDRTIRQVTSDLGGVSSLGKWKRQYDEAAPTHPTFLIRGSEMGSPDTQYG